MHSLAWKSAGSALLLPLAACPYPGGELQQVPVAVTPGNQPLLTDSPSAQALYADLNTRLAALCPEPARACVLSYAESQRCRASAAPAACSEQPTCSAVCPLTSTNLAPLGARVCTARAQPYASLAPNWYAFFESQQRSGTFNSSHSDFPLHSGNTPTPAGCTAAGMYEQARMQYLSTADSQVADGKDPFIRVELLGPLGTQVAPVYPAIARAARIQGPVVLRVHVNADGTVASLEAVSGQALLLPAAVEAVRQWHFATGPLTGKPYKYETAVTVNFSLQGQAFSLQPDQSAPNAPPTPQETPKRS